MEKLLVIGDLHLREESPYLEVGRAFLKHLLESDELNNEEVALLFLGDIYHKALPGGPVEFVFTDFLNRVKSKEVTILQGNHDYSRKNGSALEPLKCFEHVHVIDYPTELDFHGLKTLFLPYMYPQTSGITSMGKYYSDPENFMEKNYDYIFGHYGDETSGKWTQEADTSWIKGKKIFGHIHKRVSQNYLGTPYPTRRDEQGRKCQLEMIDFETKKSRPVNLPKFFDYYQVRYEEDPVERESLYSMIDIVNVPSRELGIREFQEKYSSDKTTFLGKTEKESLSQIRENIESETKEQVSVQEYIDSFAEANSISEKVVNLMKEVVVNSQVGA